MGGSVLTDPDNFLEQAALFRGDRVEIIPRWPGEISSFVSAMNDSGAALVVSYDSSFQKSLLLYRHGRLTQLDFGPTVLNPSMLAINNHGTISGTQGPSLIDRTTGFRFDPRTGDVQLLEPVQVAPRTRPRSPGRSASTSAVTCLVTRSSAAERSASASGTATGCSPPISSRALRSSPR